MPLIRNILDFWGQMETDKCTKNVHVTIACIVSNLHKKRDIEFSGGPNKLRNGTLKFCARQSKKN